MKNIKNTPNLRFSGFSDEWEEKKIDEIATIKAGGDVDKTKLKKNGDFPVYANSTNKKTSVIGYYDDYSIEAPAVTLTARGEIGIPIARLLNFTPVIRLLSLKFRNDDNVFFMENALKNIKFLSETTGVPQLTSISMHKYYLKIPKNSKEQQKIGSLFQNLDERLEIEKQKHLKLINYKKAMLENMFPKNGEKFPKLRFNGFSDEWEKCKFRDIVDLKRGLTYKPDDISKSGVRVLRSSNIDNDMFVLNKDDVFVTNEAVNIENVRNLDILITSANGSPHLVGKHAIIKNIIESKTVHGGFMLLARTKYPYFINASMSSNWYKKFISIYVAGGNGSIGNLSKKDLDEQEILLPTLAEQQKIGSFFQNLDEKIELSKNKIKKIESFKKSLLEKIFV